MIAKGTISVYYYVAPYLFACFFHDRHDIIIFRFFHYGHLLYSSAVDTAIYLLQSACFGHLEQSSSYVPQTLESSASICAIKACFSSFFIFSTIRPVGRLSYLISQLYLAQYGLSINIEQDVLI